jgi:hypothetical protein
LRSRVSKTISSLRSSANFGSFDIDSDLPLGQFSEHRPAIIYKLVSRTSAPGLQNERAAESRATMRKKSPARRGARRGAKLARLGWGATISALEPQTPPAPRLFRRSMQKRAAQKPPSRWRRSPVPMPRRHLETGHHRAPGRSQSGRQGIA